MAGRKSAVARVLVVDERDSQGDTFARAIAAAGYEACVLSKSEDAIRHARKERPELILVHGSVASRAGPILAKLLMRLVPDARVLIYTATAIDRGPVRGPVIDLAREIDVDDNLVATSSLERVLDKAARDFVEAAVAQRKADRTLRDIRSSAPPPPAMRMQVQEVLKLRPAEARFEKSIIEMFLAAFRTVRRTATELGVPHETLRSKMKKLGIRSPSLPRGEISPDDPK